MRVDEASTGFLVERIENLVQFLVRRAFVLSSDVLDNVGLIRLTRIVTFVSSVREAIGS